MWISVRCELVLNVLFCISYLGCAVAKFFFKILYVFFSNLIKNLFQILKKSLFDFLFFLFICTDDNTK